MFSRAGPRCRRGHRTSCSTSALQGTLRRDGSTPHTSEWAEAAGSGRASLSTEYTAHNDAGTLQIQFVFLSGVLLLLYQVLGVAEESCFCLFYFVFFNLITE